MDGDDLYTIGALARRTGLSVRTIRFYSDSGLVPPTGRNAGGYRLYDLAALARLDLVRTLRDLGFDLATIQRVLEREVALPDVAAAHAEALDVQIRTLRLRRAVLRAVVKHGSGPKEMELMHRLARLSDEERHRIIHDFIDEVFGGLDANPDFVAMMRSAMPDLPDDPAPEQVDAWVELAELVRDPDFKASIRRMAELQAADNAAGAPAVPYKQLGEQVEQRIPPAIAAGVEPASDEGGRVLSEVAGLYAEAFGRPDGPEFRRELLARLDVANDPRAEHYWHLLGTINGWPAQPSMMPVFEWFAEALRHHPVP